MTTLQAAWRHGYWIVALFAWSVAFAAGAFLIADTRRAAPSDWLVVGFLALVVAATSYGFYRGISWLHGAGTLGGH